MLKRTSEWLRHFWKYKIPGVGDAVLFRIFYFFKRDSQRSVSSRRPSATLYLPAGPPLEQTPLAILVVPHPSDFSLIWMMIRPRRRHRRLWATAIMPPAAVTTTNFCRRKLHHRTATIIRRPYRPVAAHPRSIIIIIIIRPPIAWLRLLKITGKLAFATQRGVIYINIFGCYLKL